MTPLVAAFLAAKHRLQHAAATAVSLAWQHLAHYDAEYVPGFLQVVLPLVRAAQLESASLTEAYVARQLTRPPLGVDPARIITGIRGGTPSVEVYRRPFVTVWSELKAGAPWGDAVRRGGERAQVEAGMDVQLAFTHTLTAVGHADTRVVGYRRVANAGACGLCSAISGRVFHKANLMPIHGRCNCGVEPVTETFESPPPLPEGVAVQDHGELGPMLVAAGH